MPRIVGSSVNAILHGIRLSFCLLSLVATAVAQTPTYYFGTFAGASSRGTADGAGGAARFSNPAGLAFDSAGNLYVADTLNHTIRKISPAGTVSTLAGAPVESGTANGTGGTARFYLPSCIVFHGDGNLYVGEGSASGGARIRRVTRDGAVTLLAGGDGTSPTDGVGAGAIFEGGAFALVSEPSGTLLAADPRTLRRVDMNGAVTTLFRKDDIWINSQFSALARDASGNVYVACNGALPQTQGPMAAQARIYRISSSGSIATFADETNGLAGVGHLNALAIDAQQNVYAAGSSGAIYRFSGGNMTVYAGMPGTIGARDGPALQALFTNLLGLAFSASGDLFASEYNNTIRRITPAGVVSTVAGMPEEDSGRHWDARGVAARFDTPVAIAVNTSGVAYVADQLNHVVRRIATDGTVTTLAGAPGQSGYADGPGAQARFNRPRDLALDSSGNVYVIEESGAVRKITPGGDVSTLAGIATTGPTPAPDGQGADARFGVLTSIAVSPQGEVFVAEAAGYSATQGSVWARLRRIPPAGVVTTLSSLPVNPHTYISSVVIDRAGVLYAADPTYQAIIKLQPDGTAERLQALDFPARRLAIDGSGTLFMTEDRSYGGTRVTRYTRDGQLDVIGGARYVVGHHDAVGTRARFGTLSGVAVDAAGAIYLTDEDNTVRKGVIAAAPSIVTQPAGQAVATGAGATFTVSAAATPEPAYQWYFNGAAIAGATASSYTIATASSANAGSYHVVVSNELGSVTSAAATLTVSTPPSGGGGSGGSSGGGGAPSDFFLAACAALALARAWRRRGVVPVG